MLSDVLHGTPAGTRCSQRSKPGLMILVVYGMQIGHEISKDTCVEIKTRKLSPKCMAQESQLLIGSKKKNKEEQTERN